MPQNPPYLPAQDAAAADWSLNFSTLLTAAPTTYGLVAGDAVAVAAVVNPWLAALVISTNPATRTPVAIAAKDAARATMESVVRPYAVNISSNAAVLLDDKVAIGVTPRITTKTRNSVTAAEISFELTYTEGGLANVRSQNPATPLSKKRPLGATSWQIQIRGKNSGDPGWTAVDLINATRPQRTLNQEDFDAQFEQYEIRLRWIGAELEGGQPNVGPWSPWTPISL